MAISSYSELKTALQNWAARSDTTFTDRQDEFIDLAEARIHYGCSEPGDTYFSPPLRVRGMETAEDITISSQTFDLTGLTGTFLQERRFYLNTDPKTDMEYYPPDRFWNSPLASLNTTGQPSIYTIEGDNLTVAPAPAASYTGKLLFYGKLAALSDSNTTNWLITNFPNVYLYAALLEAMLWDKDDAEAKKYMQLYQSAIKGLLRTDTRDRYGSQALRMYPETVDGQYNLHQYTI